MSEFVIANGELYHHGVKGMKWGVRKDKYRQRVSDAARRTIRGHGGPGIHVIGSSKRRLSRYKADLEVLDKGGHLSVGFTKKRQVAYDARDRAALNKKISKLEAKMAKVKIKDLEKQYGKLEDQMTYGKNADAKKNARIEKQMNDVESQIKKLKR